jgi:hypothetical protein
VAVVGADGNDLRGTPPKAEEANKVETAIGNWRENVEKYYYLYVTKYENNHRHR